MSIVKTYDVFCNQCSTHVGDTSDTSAREARSIARSAGWARVRVPNGSLWDFCPKCLAEFKKSKASPQ